MLNLVILLRAHNRLRQVPSIWLQARLKLDLGRDTETQRMRANDLAREMDGSGESEGKARVVLPSVCPYPEASSPLFSFLQKGFSFKYLISV